MPLPRVFLEFLLLTCRSSLLHNCLALRWPAAFVGGFLPSRIGNSSSAAVDFYVGLNRMPLGVAADSTVNFLIEHIWEVNIADETCLHCSPCPCDADMMAPMTSGAGTGKTQTTGTRWGPDGEDQTGAWYSGNTQYTRLGVGRVKN